MTYITWHYATLALEFKLGYCQQYYSAGEHKLVVIVL